MDNIKSVPFLALLVFGALACAVETSSTDELDPDEPDPVERARGTQTGGSGANPCQPDATWSDVSGALPQVGSWQGDVGPSDGGSSPVALTIEQTGSLMRSEDEGCTDLQRAPIEYSLEVEGLFAISRAGELVDQWAGEKHEELGYVRLLSTTVEPGELEPGVSAPTVEELLAASNVEGSAAPAQDGDVRLSVEVTFDDEGAQVNLTWVCFVCSQYDEPVDNLTVGVAMLEQE